ncbi:hypothetical protein MKX03_010973 [Papaver bracteatum]|nr:hypothetical protein MKX03_010973 [Papaver bracteatum]
MEKEKQAEVKLHGMWASGFSKRVELALNGDLLKYNPIHGKVPVLVHKGKPIVESLLILEYMDENWRTTPNRALRKKLLPTEPYERARIRFWAKYIDDQLFKNLITAMRKQGEEQGGGMKEFAKNLEVLEEEKSDKPAFDGESPIFLSTTLIGILGPWKTELPEVEVPEVKECFPPAEKFETLMQH